MSRPRTPSLHSSFSVSKENYIDGDQCSEDLSETLNCSVDYYNGTTIDDLLHGYKGICQAVVEFERNASTLRTNSIALTLCRRLVSTDFPCLLRHLRYSSHWPSELAKSEPAHPVLRLTRVEKETIFSAAETLQNTCTEFFRELGEIDGSTLAQEYYEIYRLSEEQPGTALGSCGNLSYFGEIRTAIRSGDKDRMMEACEALFDYIKRRLQSDAVKQGLKALIEKQDHTRSSFMDLATLAIFFSSITASMLQFSYSSANLTFSWTVVNVCWFASLVLSIASATNSFLGAIVYQSPEYLRRSRGIDHQVLQAWFKICPPILLTFSGMLFLVGICVFTFSSTQARFCRIYMYHKTSFRSDSSTVIHDVQGTTTQVATITLTSANLLALLTTFLLAFTRIIHIAAYPLMFPTRFTIDLIIVSVTFPTLHLLRLFTYVAAPFMILLFLFRYQRFPKNGEGTIWKTYIFNTVWYKVLDSFDSHWNELKKLVFVNSTFTTSSNV